MNLWCAETQSPITAQGSTILTDRLGSNVTGGKRYFPWGQEKPSATTNNTEKFTGYFRDAESGLDYADQRYHNPGSGRFITPDPVGYGLNWYSFVDGDPVNTIDPTGGTPITRFPGGGPSFVTWVNPTPLTPHFRVDHWESSIPNAPTGPFSYSGLVGPGTISAQDNRPDHCFAEQYQSNPQSMPPECISAIESVPQVTSAACPQGYSTGVDGCIKNAPSAGQRLGALLHETTNDFFSVFGFDERVPLPSCLAIGLTETLNQLNPFPNGDVPSIQDVIEGLNATYLAALRVQVNRMTFTTIMRGVAPKLSVYDAMVAAKYAASSTYAFWGGMIASEWSGLMKEIDVMNSGGCQ